VGLKEASHRLRSIKFHNFKRFKNFSISLKNANVLVGPNNAGKSSVLDSLRVLYGAYRYAARLKPHIIRTDEGDQYGYEVPESSIPIDIARVTRNFNSDVSELEFHHENGSVLKIHFLSDSLTKLWIVGSGTQLYNGSSYFSRFPVDIIIVPTLAPFDDNETYLSDQVVARERSTRLSSRHFRNIWLRDAVDFPQFQELIERTWPSVTVEAPSHTGVGKAPLEMMYYEGRMPREVSWSGFGLQVWMQIITHLMRGKESSIFVLDEPDIYLHPDMQRKLVHLVAARFSQYIIATHSTEIINEAELGDVVSIDSERHAARRVKTDGEFNDVYAYIGSLNNVEIARLSRAKRVIFFEGKDRSILNRFGRRCGVTAHIGGGDTVVIQVGGFGQWTKVLDTAWTFRNVLQIDVNIFAVFDRDYRDQRQIDLTIKNIESQGIRCAIWGRKEIENYALEVPTLVRTIKSRCEERGFILSEETVINIIQEISDQYRHDVVAQFASQRLEYERQIKSNVDTSSAFKSASLELGDIWSDLPKRLGVIPGKAFISDLSSYLQKNYQTTLTLNMVIDLMRRDEVCEELYGILHELGQFSSGL
jgi:energy-coupling factor transporter ATP-binding protein EcfA2